MRRRAAYPAGATPGVPHVTSVLWRRRQALVNNKFMGYAFAMALGVRPPVENTAHPKSQPE